MGAPDPTWAELEQAATAPKPPAGPAIQRTGPALPSPTASKAVAALASKWRRGDDPGEDTEARVQWVWHDYLGRGTITELDGKVKVSGKTTFCHHLARAILSGESFLSRYTLRGPVVYLTEEGPATFERAMATRGLKGHADFHYLSKRHAAAAPWPQLVAAARAKVIEVGAVILFVDTLGKLAGFVGDDENSAGPVMAAMMPLQALATELNIAVVVTRHERRAGGQVGESARGSTAISGDVDQILQLTRTGGDSHQNERWLKAIGRHDETPSELRIELDRGTYRVVGPEDALNRAGEALLDLLQPDEPVAVVDLLEELAEQGHSRKSVYDSVDRLVAEGRLEQIDGVGKSGRHRKMVRSRSMSGSAGQGNGAGPAARFDLGQPDREASDSVSSRTSNARAHLPFEVDPGGNSEPPTEHPRSEDGRLALPQPFEKGGSSGTTSNGPSASTAAVLRLFPGARLVSSDSEVTQDYRA